MTTRDGATSYMHVLPEHLPAVQQVVKRHDLRFLNNPAKFMHRPGKVYVIIGSHHAPMSAFSAAMNEIDEITREPEPPPAPTLLDRVTNVWRRFRGA